MSFYNDWVQANSGQDVHQVVNIEWMLRLIDSLPKVSEVPPINFMYIQFSESDGSFINPPSSFWPGTTWQYIHNTEGVFFRTEGGEADDLRQSNGIQQDRIRNIRGLVTMGSGFSELVPPTGGSVSTGVGAVSTSVHYEASGSAGQSSLTTKRSIMGLDANANYTHSTAYMGNNPMAGHANGSDIAPTNRLMRIWIRVA